MRSLRWPAIAFLAAGALAIQWGLQQPLARANAVRGARRLHTAPSSLGFRMAAGGVKEAAADALWLAVLPKLGKPWAEPMRKAAWIESVAVVMADANPRAHFPLTYSAYYVEFIQRRHPGIERILRHGMEIEKRGAFGVVTRPNAEDWELPLALGMNLVLFGKGADKEQGLAWLRATATKPDCPSLVIDYVAGLRAREGDPLEGWRIWGLRAGLKEGKEWQEICLREADRARVEALERWAIAAGKRLGRWPATVEEVLADAPPATREFLARKPEVRAALVDGVVLHGPTRDIEIPALSARLETSGAAEIREAVRAFQAERGRLPRDLKELGGFLGRSFLPPPRNGTRWELDSASGEPRVLADLVDPRLGR